MKLTTKANTHMALSYYPELDITPELNYLDTTWFQETIGILR